MNFCKICDEKIENDYKLCNNCIRDNIEICTCDKNFIEEIPKIIKIKDDYYTIPEKIPEYFFTRLTDKFYGIKGCRGCVFKYSDKKISVKNNFKEAIRASISSCIYQKIEIDEKNIIYEYITDALDPFFEDYLQQNNIKIGESLNLQLNFNN